MVERRETDKRKNVLPSDGGYASISRLVKLLLAKTMRKTETPMIQRFCELNILRHIVLFLINSA